MQPRELKSCSPCLTLSGPLAGRGLALLQGTAWALCRPLVPPPAADFRVVAVSPDDRHRDDPGYKDSKTDHGDRPAGRISLGAPIDKRQKEKKQGQDERNPDCPDRLQPSMKGFQGLIEEEKIPLRLWDIKRFHDVEGAGERGLQKGGKSDQNDKNRRDDHGILKYLIRPERAGPLPLGFVPGTGDAGLPEGNQMETDAGHQDPGKDGNVKEKEARQGHLAERAAAGQEISCQGSEKGHRSRRTDGDLRLPVAPFVPGQNRSGESQGQGRGAAVATPISQVNWRGFL